MALCHANAFLNIKLILGILSVVQTFNLNVCDIYIDFYPQLNILQTGRNQKDGFEFQQFKFLQ